MKDVSVISYGERSELDPSKTELCRVTPATNPRISATEASKEKLGTAKFEPQGFFCVWHGSTMGGWAKVLASKPPIHWSRLHKIASVSAFSVINSISSSIESMVYGSKIAQQPIEHSPVFVLGHWRSGTTLLHNLICLDSQFTYPNLYEVLFPGSFLLTERFVTTATGWMIPKTRPMDNVETGYHMPQEDEVALLLLSGLSPYLILAHPYDTSKFERYYELKNVTPAELQQWKDSFLYFIKKLTIKHNKPIVFKSPSHTFRIPVLLDMFPNAKFIYIYRDPYAVYSSSMHLRRTLFAENGLSKVVMNEKMQEDAMDLYSYCIDTYEKTRGLIPAGNLCEVRFEDLESDPLGQMHRIYDTLNLKNWDQVEPAIQQKVPELTRYRKNSFKMDEDLMRKVYHRFKPSFDRYGYPARLADLEQSSPSGS